MFDALALQLDSIERVIFHKIAPDRFADDRAQRSQQLTGRVDRHTTAEVRRKVRYKFVIDTPEVKPFFVGVEVFAQRCVVAHRVALDRAAVDVIRSDKIRNEARAFGRRLTDDGFECRSNTRLSQRPLLRLHCCDQTPQMLVFLARSCNAWPNRATTGIPLRRQQLYASIDIAAGVVTRYADRDFPESLFVQLTAAIIYRHITKCTHSCKSTQIIFQYLSCQLCCLLLSC